MAVEETKAKKARVHRKQDIRIEQYEAESGNWREKTINAGNKEKIVDAGSAWRYVRDECEPGRYRVIDVKDERTLAEESKPVRRLT